MRQNTAYGLLTRGSRIRVPPGPSSIGGAMCELTVYAVKGADRNKVMEGVVRLFLHDDKVLAEGILGDSIEIVGQLTGVDMIAQKANITVK